MKIDRPPMSSQYEVKMSIGSTLFMFTEFSGIKDATDIKSYKDPFLHRVFAIPGSRTYQPVELSSVMLINMFKDIDTLWANYNNEPLVIEITPGTCSGVNTFKPFGFRYVLTGCTWLSFEHSAISRQSEQPIHVRIKLSYASYQKVVQ